MGLAWQQGPLSSDAVGRFLVAEALPDQMLYAERLRRRVRVRQGGEWIADSEDIVLLHEPRHYPVMYFPRADVNQDALESTDRTTTHQQLGRTAWFTVRGGEKTSQRAACQHIALPPHASELSDRVAFAWAAMDGYYEEDERILGHAADPYHRNDIRRSSRRVVVRDGDRVVANTQQALVLYESGFAPRWYIPRADIDDAAMTPVPDFQTFCPYKGLASYYDVGDRQRVAWSYREAWPEVRQISDLVSFESAKIDVYVDDTKLHEEAGQAVYPHGLDRGFDVGEFRKNQLGA